MELEKLSRIYEKDSISNINELNTIAGTNIEIIDYMEASKNLRFSADCTRVYNPNALSVWLQIDGNCCIEIKGGTSVDLHTVL